MSKSSIEYDINNGINERLKTPEIKQTKKEMSNNVRKIKKDIPTSVNDDINKGVQFVNKSSNESEIGKSIDILQNPKRPETTTILSHQQVNALVLMNWVANVYDVPFFKNYVEKYPLYKISSQDGRGRKESIEIAKSLQLNNDERDRKLMELFKR